MSLGIILLIVAVVVVLMVIGVYNRLVALRQNCNQAFADIDVQLRQRHDLIPNLVETVKGYAAHEKGTLDAVIQARNTAVTAQNSGDPKAMGQAEGVLGQALGRLFALSEAYPDLKANQNFLSLQQELTETENRVAFSRQGYNDSVTQLNTAIQTFPTVLIAGMFGFKEEPFFETPSEEKKAPTVQF